MFLAEFLVLSLTTLSLFSSVQSSGVRVQFSQLAAEYASQVGLKILIDKLYTQVIPDQSGQADVVVGRVDYTISTTVIVAFTEPSTTVTINPGSGLTWTLQNGAIKVNGRWSYEYWLLFIPVRDSGIFDLTLSGATASVSVTIDRLANGNPSIKMLSCSCTIANVDVDFRGGIISWVYNLFAGFVEGPLKVSLQKEVCKAAEKTINDNFATLLATFKTNVTLREGYVLDNSLTDSPNFYSGYFVASLKGEVFHLPDKTPAPFSEPNMLIPPPTRMFSVYITDYLPNTLCWVLHNNNAFTYTLTKSDVPEKVQPFFATTCPKGVLCFGTLFPGLAKNHPNANIEMSMATTVAPTLTINSQSIIANMTGRVQIYVKNSNDETANLLSLAVTIIFKVTPSVRGYRILASVAEITPRIKVESSPIGTEISEKNLNTLIEVVIEHFIEPTLNSVGTEGIDLPSLAYVDLVGSTIELMPRAVVVSAGLVYTPKK